MKIYEVGGCVRDRILGLEPKDIDYVVVGSSEKEMHSLGYSLVGKDFPVFLHPQTGYEYALARKEKKVGVGYSGFETDVVNVSLEEDLFRRDLTINAIAMDSNGKIIDPYKGTNDLRLGILRHVSNHFSEDPVRILRIARFSARYNFKIADETYELMRGMVANGEFDHLTKERVWAEVEKSLGENYLQNFFTTLEKIGALEKLFSFEQLPYKNFFETKREFNQKLCHIFSNCSEQEIKKWKMPDQNHQLILQYKKYNKNDHFYSELSNEEKISFISLTKAMHNIPYSLELLDIIINYQKFNQKTKDIEYEKQQLSMDINLLKSIDYENLAKQIIDKKNIGKEIKSAQIEALQIKKSPKLKF